MNDFHYSSIDIVINLCIFVVHIIDYLSRDRENAQKTELITNTYQDERT